MLKATDDEAMKIAVLALCAGRASPDDMAAAMRELAEIRAIASKEERQRVEWLFGLLNARLAGMGR